MINRLKVALIIVSVVISLIAIGIVISTQLGKTPKNPSPETIAPTFVPTPTSVTKTSGPYSKLIDKIEKRPPLEKKDKEIRGELINSINGTSGTLYSTQDFQIYYIKTPDIFQVKLLNPEVNSAKQMAVMWFGSKGLSKKGICNLPIIFYLDLSITSQLPELKDTFSPLPEGC